MCSQLRLIICDPGTVDFQAPLFMGFPRQEYWSGWSFPTPGDLPDPGTELASPASAALAGGFFTTEPLGKLTSGTALALFVGRTKFFMGRKRHVAASKDSWKGQCKNDNVYYSDLVWTFFCLLLITHNLKSDPVLWREAVTI